MLLSESGSFFDDPATKQSATMQNTQAAQYLNVDLKFEY